MALIVKLEESNNSKALPKLLMTMPVQHKNSVAEVSPVIAKDKAQGQATTGTFTRQSPSIGNGGLRREGNRFYATTQDRDNVDLMPATMNLVSNEWLDSLVYTQPRLCPGLTKERRLDLCAEFLRAHQDKVMGCSPAYAQ